MCLNRNGAGCVAWIGLAQDSKKLQAVVHTVMIL